MSKAALCPVCNGEGYVIRYESTTPGGFRVTCHGCGGKGWVEVSDDPPQYYPYRYPSTDYYWYDHQEILW